MTIDGIGPIDHISKVNKTDKTSKPVRNEKSDSISLSSEARNKAELLAATENMKNVDDVRMDRVEEVKKKLQDPNYINSRVIESVADKIIDLFGV
ncbi:MAG: flagellar biosynthesis anti-sigma factor FlgM [Spirochaetales bacterium]|nr:flagellar biosynthesis anti-sigma factor FlgM [Spirochaetales bacterium]MCF7938763.1 flagellar biosynthesis anti-sigma factor FlgM [Spirochaetales bacterium]